MWCPGLAAILTRLWYQKNLRGFGWGLGKPRWLLLSAMIPIVVGLLMFGSAWVFGVAPLDPSKVAKVWSVSAISPLLIGLVFFCSGTLGEELGWRGLLVPELARCMSFTKLALLSGGVWAVWHFPLRIFHPSGDPVSLWLSLAALCLLMVSSGIVQAWVRLRSGSVWPCVILHGFWNYFIQLFYPTLTQHTPAGEKMLGEYGWFSASLSTAFLIISLWYMSRRADAAPPPESSAVAPV